MADELTMAERLAAPMSYGWVPLGRPKPNPNGSGHLCEGAPYITADEARNRLNEVFGPLGWRPEFQLLYEICEPGRDKKPPVYVCAMDCTIYANDPTLKWADGSHSYHSIAKTDTGHGRSKTAEDARKSAYSDSLKRAAGMYGVGYFLEHIPKRWMPCHTKDGRGEYFTAWADCGGETLPEIDRRLDAMVEDYRTLGIVMHQLEGWVGPRSKWTADTLYTLIVYHAQVVSKRAAKSASSTPREEAGSHPHNSPASPSIDGNAPAWTDVYPDLRQDTQAMVRAWEKAGMEWRDIEIESRKKLNQLDKAEVNKLFESIRREHARKGNARS